MSKINDERFWNIIKKARTKSKGNQNTMLQEAHRQLLRLNPNDIIDWQIIFDKYIALVNTDALREVACSNRSYISDDGFLYFRSWLISQGKEVYYNAIENPNSLSDIVNDVDNTEFELLMYVAPDAFTETCDGDFYKLCNATIECKKENDAINEKWKWYTGSYRAEVQDISDKYNAMTDQNNNKKLSHVQADEFFAEKEAFIKKWEKETKEYQAELTTLKKKYDTIFKKIQEGK